VNWIEQNPHAYASNARPLHILVSDDKYVAFVSKEDDGFKAFVPNLKVLPRGQSNSPSYHFTHDTLQEAKDWCIAELWKRRLEQ
jgi:hypothetical protein